MITKLAYVVVCSESDNYIEQTALSAYSARKNNPDADILLVVDDATNKQIEGNRNVIMQYVSEKIVVSTPAEYNNKQKSRYLKTTLREHIKGDYLFIDSDTIITESLQMADTLTMDIGAVLDVHLPLSASYYTDKVKTDAKKMGWYLTSKDELYYNSGVMYVKDNETAHALYKQWHENWKLRVSLGLVTDQPALGMANAQLGYVIQELSGEWNCQLMLNGLPYLHKAKIIHYFSTSMNNKSKENYYFKNSNIYDQIRTNGYIPDDVANMVGKARSAFLHEEMVIMSGKRAVFQYTPIIRMLWKSFQSDGILFRIHNLFGDIYYWIGGIIKIILKK